MRLVHCFRFYAASMVAMFSTVAFCDASFNTSSSLQLTTADLSAQNVQATFTTDQPTLNGYVNPGPSFGNYFASGYAIFPTGSNKGTNQLNLTITTAANGNATSFGSAYASSVESQLVSFYNFSNVTQTFDMNWTYTLATTVSANNGSATSNSTTEGTRGLGNAPYWSNQAMAFTPTVLSANASNSGVLTFTLDASTATYIYITSTSNGLATSYVASTPEPSGVAALCIGSLGLLTIRRMRGR